MLSISRISDLRKVASPNCGCFIEKIQSCLKQKPWKWMNMYKDGTPRRKLDLAVEFHLGNGPYWKASTLPDASFGNLT